ncbi:MAG TPA: hypothetical protein VLS89_11775, partial [Candidatus Nanopelagicales bacterium]|nr:hypothetical protein [Candidatus Nanopelagicales bacterium]
MRVNVLRVGKAAASGLLIAGAPGTLGCAADEAEGGGEAIDSSGDALNPGAATLMLTDGASDIYLSQSTTDEFLRVGETLNVKLPG